MPNSWAQRRVLVTGATGFVGSWLVRRLLREGASVVCFVRDWDPQSNLIRSGDVDRTTVVLGQLQDRAAVERAVAEHTPDTVFHLGAQTIVGTALRAPMGSFESNIRGTYHVLEACRRYGDQVNRVLIASSDKAYGESETLPYDESMPPLGSGPYEVSKACADLLSRTYHETYGLPTVIARCGNIYGGGDLNWSRVVPGTIRSLLGGQRPIIRSDGTYTRDYVFVEDAVDAYLAMADSAHLEDVRGQPFNFGPESPVDVLTLVDIIRRLMDRSDLEPVIKDTATAEIRDQYLSSEKARRVLGWSPAYDLETGLRETIAWYRNYLGVPH